MTRCFSGKKEAGEGGERGGEGMDELVLYCTVLTVLLLLLHSLAMTTVLPSMSFTVVFHSFQSEPGS